MKPLQNPRSVPVGQSPDPVFGKHFRKPHAVQPGDTIAGIWPAWPFDRAAAEARIAVVRRPYRGRYDERVYSRQRYLAGDDERRLAELTGALGDPEIKAVFCARGGYGTMRLLAK